MEALNNGLLVLASGNAGKLRELAQLLQPMGFTLRAQSEWGTPEAVEDAPTFIENALIKARHAAAHTGHAAIADDSGLVVPALGGEPGIRSARYGADHGAPGGDSENNQVLLRRMSDLHGPERRAFFYCAMVLTRSERDPAPLVATAAWWGAILHEPRGKHGFGYDPLFWVAEHDCSSAQLSPELKNSLSHRGRAVRTLLGALGR